MVITPTFPTFFLFPPSFKNTSSHEFKTRARKKASADCLNSNSGAKVHNVGEVGVMAPFQSSKAIISGLYFLTPVGQQIINCLHKELSVSTFTSIFSRKQKGELKDTRSSERSMSYKKN